MELTAEWLEADGSGGFASGTVSGERTRRYDALLLAATTPPTGRVVLVNGAEAWVETGSGRSFLSTQRYQAGVVYPEGWRAIGAFTRDPWPRWEFKLADGGVTQEILVTPEGTALRWTYAGSGPCRLFVRPLLSGRDYHALHHENPAFNFTPEVADGAVTWRPYAGLPPITAQGGFAYQHEPEWYRRFLYTEEQARGLDCIEDLASPGVLEWDLAAGPALLLLRTGAPGPAPGVLIEAERGLRSGKTPIDRAADQYLVRRGTGLTIVAGYPWFTDWGRDTFISMRGLMLARGRLEAAGQILAAWAGVVSEGMLPNFFPDQGGAPEFNSVDASLWFVIVASEYLARVPAASAQLVPAIEAILTGYANGTRYGIAADADGLLRSGAPGVALTWMDARVGDWVVTPRRGKPVEVQALWINALHVGAAWSARWDRLERQVRSAFLDRFPDKATGGLFDVVDVEGAAGAVDRSIRPNQILAVGGLPLPLLDGVQAARVVALVEAKLLTPLGLRTLAPGDPAYTGHYRGGPRERDAAYHQGTVWPWLMGPFVEAWLRVHGATAQTRQEASSRFLSPLLTHLDTAGLGHVSEIADGDAPHLPSGCPFQAWSLGELIRIQLNLT